MINTISRKLATNIKNVVPDHPRSVDVLAFSISFILNTVLVIVFALLISVFTDRVSETAIALISYAVLRLLSGGAHLNSGVLCVLSSTAVITAISFAQWNNSILLGCNIVSLLLCLIYAPSKLEGTRIPVRYYPFLKLLSLLVVASNFFIGSAVIATAFAIQSISLIRWRR
jgi:accessory gene regulator B